jgi:hypothetical protein
VDRLAEVGPVLGRPLVDRIKGSRLQHPGHRSASGPGPRDMKELRPGSAGASESRVLFAFDPVRRAVLLVAGDKAGSWHRWYEAAVPLADDRYDAHLAELGRREYR